MHGKNQRGRFRLLMSLGLSLAALLIGIAGLLILNSLLLKLIAALLVASAWTFPVLLTVRYRTAIRSLKPVSKSEEVRVAQREMIAAVEDSRWKTSRHEYHQEQTLVRIENEVRRLSVVSPEVHTSINRETPIDVLFVTSNGAGLGHVSRLLAVAEKLPTQRQYELLTLSKAYRQVASEGLTVHYFPSSEAADERPERWNRVFQNYFKSLLIKRKPKVVVFDGTWVYRGITEVCRAVDIPIVWVQRGMWKPDVDEASQQRHRVASVADHLIVPGDFADSEVVDAGNGIDPHYVEPIVRTSSSDLLSRSNACAKLGLDSNKRYVLLNLGGGSTGEADPTVRSALESIREYSPDLIPVQVVSPLSTNSEAFAEVLRISAYPIMECAQAFEYMIAAAGYNSAQEAVALSIPSILVPNKRTKTDDQVRRASRLADRGLCVNATGRESLIDAVAQMSVATFRDEVKTRCDHLKAPCGAEEAAVVLENIIEKSQWRYQAETIGETRYIGG